MKLFLPISVLPFLFHFKSAHSFFTVTQFSQQRNDGPQSFGFRSIDRSITLSTQLEQSSPAVSTVDIIQPKPMPPVLSKVIEGLPSPFSGVSGTGTFATQVLSTLFNFGFFRSLLFLNSRFIWPIHLQVMQKYGATKALFLTSNINVLMALIPLMTLLTVPALVPTSPESKPVAQKNFKKMVSFLSSSLFLINVLQGLTVPSWLFYVSSPASVLQSTALPCLGFTNLCKQFLFFTLITDFSYYFLHRLMHDARSKNPVVKWLNKIHRVHHSNDHSNLLPYDSFRIHPADFFFAFLCIFLGVMLYKPHPLIFQSFSAFVVGYTMFDHCDYVQMADSHHHVIHHQRSNCNYSHASDYLFKTTRAKSVDLLFRLATLKRSMRKKLSSKEMDDLMNNISTDAKTKYFKADETVVHYGDPAKSFFVLLDGTCTASLPNIEDDTNTVVAAYEEPGSFFGELALLRSQPRAATVKAGKFGATVAEISESKFSLLSNITSTFEENAASYIKQEDRTMRAELKKYSSTNMAQKEFGPGETIIQQGDKGDCMYILEEGTCSAFKDNELVYDYKESGDYFGELALLNNEPRKASIVAGDNGATVAVVTRALFDKVVAWSDNTAQQKTLTKYASVN